MPDHPTESRGRLARWLTPSLADLLFAVLLAVMFGRPEAWQALLADGDTGWHIRTGELILSSGRIPFADPFSFSRPGGEWFAWEWGAEIVLSLLHRAGGLAAVAAFAALVLCLSALALFLWMLRRGAGLWIALAVSLVAMSASSVHFLARPHIFSILFATASLWMVDEDRRAPSRRAWLLVPLTALWANLHAGFAAWLGMAALLAAAEAARGQWKAARRYGWVAAGCAAASLANPYGWELHRHIVRYLGSDWILNSVQEFRSPEFRGENMAAFAALLLAGMALSGRAWKEGRWFEAALLTGWAWAALRSARHIPLYAVAAAPAIASACAGGWGARAARSGSRSGWRILWELSQELGQKACRPSVWLPVGGAVAIFCTLPPGRLADFPEQRFPVAAVARHRERLAPAGAMPRILASDQWGDYLIYRLYPRQRVFFDGRSDFYGPAIGADYACLMSGRGSWSAALERHRFDLALVAQGSAVAGMLEREPGWREVDSDQVARLFERLPLKPAAVGPKR